MEMIPPGRLGWLDLTVDAAPEVRDFYSRVIGWKPEGVEMDGYDDFNMLDDTGEPVAGICHRQGMNAGIPPVWIPYFIVEDIETATKQAVRNGGEEVELRREEDGTLVLSILKDPAGAVFALFQSEEMDDEEDDD